MGQHFVKKDLTSLSGISDGLLKFLKSLWDDTLVTARGSKIIAFQRLSIASDIMETLQFRR